MLEIEEANLVNPNYHEATDTISTLDLQFHAEVTRATLAALTDLANQP